MKQGMGEKQRPSQIITKLPLEDMRELWYWGPWKEPVASGFSKTVVVICTSRDACRRYHRGRTTDRWLLVDNGYAEPDSAPPEEPSDADLFNEGDRGHQGGRFTKMSYAEIVAIAKARSVGHPTHRRGPTVLVNPRYETGQSDLVTDAIFADVQELLKAVPSTLVVRSMTAVGAGLRPCLRDPIPELAAAAATLSRAVAAHASGDRRLAAELKAWRHHSKSRSVRKKPRRPPRQSAQTAYRAQEQELGLAFRSVGNKPEAVGQMMILALAMAIETARQHPRWSVDRIIDGSIADAAFEWDLD